MSACEIAFTVTTVCALMLEGAVYVPEVEILPFVEFPPVTPFTCHVTLVLLLLCTVAVNFWVLEARREALVGETETVTEAAKAGVTNSQLKVRLRHNRGSLAFKSSLSRTGVKTLKTVLQNPERSRIPLTKMLCHPERQRRTCALIPLTPANATLSKSSAGWYQQNHAMTIRQCAKH